jgi:hypothetical protein
MLFIQIVEMLAQSGLKLVEVLVELLVSINKTALKSGRK